MKNPEIMDANGTPESLSIMFHKDNCSVIAIQDATEDSVTGPELAANLNKLRLFSRFQFDRETNEGCFSLTKTQKITKAVLTANR